MKSEGFFWPSFVDLMTSLFFIMLVLFGFSYIRFRQEKAKLEASARQMRKIKELEESVKTLMTGDNLVAYDSTYSRYTFVKDVSFKHNEFDLSKPVQSLTKDVDATIAYLDKVGQRLRELAVTLKKKKEADPTLRNVSYVLMIVGSASDLKGDRLKYSAAKHPGFPDYDDYNYSLSYRRAKALYNYWKSQGLDFNDEDYHSLLQLTIAGNGLGGVGRYPDSNWQSVKNQRFLIELVPKIGAIGE